MNEEIDEKMFMELLDKQVEVYPTHHTTLINIFTNLTKIYSVPPKEQIYEKIVDKNCKCIEQKFIAMMQLIFQNIEPQLPKFKKYGSTSYLNAIIQISVDPEIYKQEHFLNFNKQTPLPKQNCQSEISLQDQFFSQLFEIINQLFLIMKDYYGYKDNDKIGMAVYESIIVFSLQNQGCFIVQEDVHIIENQQKQQMQQKKGFRKSIKDKKDQKISKILSSLQQSSKSQTIIQKGYSFIGSILTQGKNIITQRNSMQPIQQKQQEIPNQRLMDEKQIRIILDLNKMSMNEIISTMEIDEKQKFINFLTDMLGQLENLEEVSMQVMKFIENVMNSQPNNENNKIYQQYKQVKWLVMLFNAFQESYCIERKRFLQKVINKKQILQKIWKPINILRFIESLHLPSNQIVQKFRTLPIATQTTVKQPNRLSRNNNECNVHMDIQHEIHRIHLYELKKKYDTPPLLQFQKLTSHSNHRTLTFLISGFMSEDTCKKTQWGGLLQTIGHTQVYSIRWESKTIENMKQFAVEGVKDLVKSNLSIGMIGKIGGPYLRAASIVLELYKKYNDNPFNPAIESAKKTGEFLGQFFAHNFEGYFINFVGFSLGTELITNILKKMEDKNSLNKVNKVYYLGGAADKIEVQTLLQRTKANLHIYNLHSDNDYALKYLLRVCKPKITPIGIHPLKKIHGHTIINKDCSTIVDGHTSYRQNLKPLSSLLQIADD